MLSEASGAPVNTTALSHLRAWQEVVTMRGHHPALISSHQSASDFCWIGGNSTTQHLQWTYSDLDRAARRLATTLNRLTPLNKRPIAILADNQAEWLLFFWAAAYLHSPLAPINPKCASRRDEVKHMLSVVQPAVIVAANGTISQQLDENGGLALSHDSTVKIILSRNSQGSWQSLDEIMTGDMTPPDTPTYADPLETAVILFTSGTTSLPKPCGISSAQTANAAFVYVEPRALSDQHRYISQLPNFHSYGIGWMLAFLLIGGTVILPSQAFEARATLECIEKYRATHMSLVPTTAQTIMAHPAYSSTNISSLIGIDMSGAGIVPSVLESCERQFRTPIGSSYGMTESPTTLIWHTSDGYALRAGAVLSGRPSRGARAKICDPHTRLPVRRGEAGELHSGGVQVIRSYMHSHIAPDTFYVDEEGCPWIMTGDQAVMEHDGNIRICGRYKDLIIRGGENISPANIEAFLQRSAGIFIAQVIGVPDDIAGEVPIAVIQTDGLEVCLDQLKSDTMQALGPAFAPKMILKLKEDLGMDSFPTTAAGKIRKVELSALVQAYLHSQTSHIGTSTATVDVLLDIWRDISGVKMLLPETTLQSFADSLMMMQLSSLVKKKLNKDITVEAFKDCTTILDQSDLIDMSSDHLKPVTMPKRNSPPSLNDLPYLQSHEAYHTLKSIVGTVLEQHHLRWDDVEDIAPLPDWSVVFAHSCRRQSWNLRWTYHAKVDCLKLLTAMRSMLHYHPALRSVIVNDIDEFPLLVSLKANERWYNTAITSGHVVDCKEDLDKLLLDDNILDSAIAGGPQFRIHVASIRSDGTSGLVVIGSHAVCDMSMTKLWLDDVASLLDGQDRLTPHVSFFEYARAYNSLRDSTEAQTGINYWTKKLKNVGNLSEQTYWPEQRAPEFFKGNDSGWSRFNGRPGRRVERQLPLQHKIDAQRGLREVVSIVDLTKLKAEHNVPVFMLVKSAIALMNIKRTHQREAIFGTLNAARTWPFSSSYTAEEREMYAGNPLDISGSTTEYVLDRVEVDKSSTIIDFMRYVTKDEENNSAHVKAPFLLLADALRDTLDPDDERTWAERERDAEAVLSLIRRQSFNWLPTPPSAQDNEHGLQLLRLLSRMDNGLTIGGFLANDKSSVVINFTWDAEHLTMIEATAALGDLARLVSIMGQATSWHTTVDDVLAVIETAP